jgi:hypothetical protein
MIPMPPNSRPPRDVKGTILTHIVLYITDVERGGRNSQAQPIFLGDKDGLGKAMLLHVAQCELAACHTGHHIFSTVGEAWVRGHATSGLCLPGQWRRSAEAQPSWRPPGQPQANMVLTPPPRSTAHSPTHATDGDIKVSTHTDEGH